MFSVQSETEATIVHLETAIIIKREETMAGQDKWYGKA
jgi:hypothetical protein